MPKRRSRPVAKRFAKQLAGLAPDIKRWSSDKKFRPTVDVVAFVGRGRKRVLFGISATSGNPTFPKGGIRPSETVLRAARRETHEEFSIAPATLRFLDLIGVFLSVVEDGEQKKGYRLGKAHIALTARIPKRASIKNKPQEISQWLIVDSQEAFAALMQTTLTTPQRTLRLYLMLKAAGVPWVQ